MCFFCPKGWKRSLFSEPLAGSSTLFQWTPCCSSKSFLISRESSTRLFDSLSLIEFLVKEDV